MPTLPWSSVFRLFSFVLHYDSDAGATGTLPGSDPSTKGSSSDGGDGHWFRNSHLSILQILAPSHLRGQLESGPRGLFHSRSLFFPSQGNPLCKPFSFYPSSLLSALEILFVLLEGQRSHITLSHSFYRSLSLLFGSLFLLFRHIALRNQFPHGISVGPPPPFDLRRKIRLLLLRLHLWLRSYL